MVQVEFKNILQTLNKMDIVIVRKKLNFNDFSAFTRIDQACYSECSVYLLSATEKSSLLVKSSDPLLV
jgi:hypothetical protein